MPGKGPVPGTTECSSRLQVLVIDDQESHLQLIRDMLQEDGLSVICCSTAADALVQLEVRPFFAIVVDLRLPDCSGIELLRQIKTRDPTTPIIVHTAFGSYDTVKDALNSGAFAYVEKLKDPSEIVKCVRRAVTNRLNDVLDESRQRYEYLWNQIADALFLHDQDGRLLDVNQSACDLLGYSRDELFERLITDLEDVPGLSKLLAHVNRMCAGKAVSLESQFRHKDGTEIPVEVRAALVEPGREGEPSLILATARDVTEQRLSEQNLKEANAALRQVQQVVIQQERLRALGAMASGIAHDLNNTLSPIIGYAEILLSDSELPARAKRLVHHIEVAGRDAAAVVDRLRQFYRPRDDSGDHEVIRLTALLQTIPMFTRPKWHDEALRKGRTIGIELQLENDVRVIGNAAELREMVTNFVINAVEAMTADGQITLALCADDRQAILEVSDTGVGMSEEVACRCFEPFFTSQKEHGTGLGLSVCHGIVQRHHGSIDVDTKPGEGTTFRVFLPRFTNTATITDEPTIPHMPGRKVLYIDDDHRLCDVASKLLTRLGHAVDVAHSGADGIELVRAHRYDVVVTDLAMPGINGHDVTRIVKLHQPETPVILVTGWDSEGKAVSDDPGAAPECIVNKPLTGYNLQTALRQVLALEDQNGEAGEDG